MRDMKKKENISIPETREERIKRLTEAGVILKSEFIGLDSIIDELLDSISSWYVTPEIINRPVVVSLFGLTGTGKTSIVRRLTSILGLDNTTMFFDCGECTSENKDISSNICDTLGLDSDDYGSLRAPGGECKVENPVFVFDEFQYARTLNEDGEEEIKSSLRPIWSLMDSGLIDINDSYSWSFNQFVSFTDDFGSFALVYPDIRIEKNMVNEREAVKLYLGALGLMYYNREVVGLAAKDEAEGDDDPYAPVRVLDSERIKTIIRRLNEIEVGLGLRTAQELANGTFTAMEFYIKLKEVKSKISRPKQLDCSNALVFIIGNLDEAFEVSGEMNPDIDANMFYDITSRVTVADIKKALKNRFRPEQIARLGNNLIKYPTLTEDSFKKIITKEVKRIVEEFKNLGGPELILSDEIYDLLYTEGVYPTQGVRPVFTTIGTLLTPYLSRILINKVEDTETVMVGIKDPTDWTVKGFKIPETTITITYDDGRVFEYTHKLQLGAIRDPKSRKKRYASSVHEAGHAVLYSWCTGNYPETIVSVSTDHGGFCSTYDKDSEGEIDSRRDVDNNTMIALAGYIAEHEFFDPSMCLMGSGSDLEDAWDRFSSAAYTVGYFEPVTFSNYNTESTTAIASGISSDTYVDYFDGKEIKFKGSIPLDQAIQKRFKELREEVKKIIKEERGLIKEIAIYLGKSGSMTKETFEEMVAKYGKILTPETIKERKALMSPDYYGKCLGINEEK